MAIIKNVVLCILLLLTGCPIYDPPQGGFNVINKSDSIWYVYSSCEERLSYDDPLVYYITNWGEGYDEHGNKKDLSGFPYYRLASNDTSFFIVSGTVTNPKILCDDGTFSLFFIKDDYLKNLSWEEICRDQKYSHKFDFTQNQLDSMNWTFVFSNN